MTAGTNVIILHCVVFFTPRVVNLRMDYVFTLVLTFQKCLDTIFLSELNIFCFLILDMILDVVTLFVPQQCGFFTRLGC